MTTKSLSYTDGPCIGDDALERKSLFLLEVMVKKIDVDADVLLESFTFDPSKVKLIDVTSKIQFSNFYGLNIDSCGYVERGLGQKKDLSSVSTTTLDLEKTPLAYNLKSGDDSPIQGGKSCLFPMIPDELIAEIQATPLYVDVFSKDKTAVFLGKTKIYLGDNFVDVVASSRSCTDLPISAFMKSCAPISNLFGQTCGLIEIYVRLSCFGKSILSDFNVLSSEREKSTEIKKRWHKAGKINYS